MGVLLVCLKELVAYSHQDGLCKRFPKYEKDEHWGCHVCEEEENETVCGAICEPYGACVENMDAEGCGSDQTFEFLVSDSTVYSTKLL